MDKELQTLSQTVGNALLDQNYWISTAESCTGGLLSHVLIANSGSSAYFKGGIVAYSNEIKEKVLGVQAATLQAYGAVSEQTAREMAEGIREKFGTDIGLSTTGIAGPKGGTPDKPIGLVWMGISTSGHTMTFECHFKGERLDIMRSTVIEILTFLLNQFKPSKKRGI